MKTPDLFRIRGVIFAAHVERPIPVDAVQGILLVFSGQVDGILEIPVHGWNAVDEPDDGEANYTMHGPWAQVPETGLITVPINFRTGSAWDEEVGRFVDGLGPPNPRLTNTKGESLVVGIDYFLPVSGCCGDWQISTLLHEFGHNLGLADLYDGNKYGIQGCQELEVLMANRTRIQAGNQAPAGVLVFRRQVLNESASPDLEIWDTYYDFETNRLVLAQHSVDWAGGLPTQGYSNQSYDLNDYRSRWTREEAEYLGIQSASSVSCPEEGLPTTLPRGTLNQKPAIAALLASFLAGFGLDVASGRPWSFSERSRRGLTWMTISFPFVLTEGVIGSVSWSTGLLGVPPVLGWGTLLDLVVAIGGLAVSLVSWYRASPSV